MKHIYNAINRSESSILQKLKREFPGIKLSDYITFNALRNFGVLNSKPVTEQVYVHAKMMIVDDRIAIIGSANINDRSMEGSRDSEICAVVENQDLIDSVMAGKPFKVSKFVQDLRLRLWRDFLGLSDHDMSIRDPVSSNVYKNIWRETAKMNTWIYKKVFQVLPDTVRKLGDMKIKLSPQHVTLLRDVKGYLVEFPKNFLADEQLNLTLFDRSYVLPKSVFV